MDERGKKKKFEIQQDLEQLISDAFLPILASNRNFIHQVSNVNPRYRQHTNVLRTYKNQVVKEHDKDFLQMLKVSLLYTKNTDSSVETKIYLESLVRTHYRHSFAVLDQDHQEEVKQLKGRINDAYQDALCSSNLSYASPLHLSFALELSVNYEQLQDHEKAIEIADEAFRKALPVIDDLQDDVWR